MDVPHQRMIKDKNELFEDYSSFIELHPVVVVVVVAIASGKVYDSKTKLFSFLIIKCEKKYVAKKMFETFCVGNVLYSFSLISDFFCFEEIQRFEDKEKPSAKYL